MPGWNSWISWMHGLAEPTFRQWTRSMSNSDIQSPASLRATGPTRSIRLPCQPLLRVETDCVRVFRISDRCKILQHSTAGKEYVPRLAIRDHWFMWMPVPDLDHVRATSRNVSRRVCSAVHKEHLDILWPTIAPIVSLEMDDDMLLRLEGEASNQ